VFFHVRDLALKSAQFDVVLEPGKVDFMDPKVRQKGPLYAKGKAELASEMLGEIRIRAHVKVEMEADCDRCLEPATFPIEEDFVLLYRPMADSAAEEAELDEDESEVGFYEGDGVELNDVLREYLLLALPMQRLCSEACKGICPDCGQNLNQQQCGCAAKKVDDRWEALKQLKK
jgi:uncharacterized protein